jgi:hypothetical protein
MQDFFTKSLPIFCGLLCSAGAIYLGLSPGVFIQVVDHEDNFKTQFWMSLVHKDDINELHLVEGSHGISEDLYQDANIFWGKDQDPEHKLGFSTHALHQKGVAGTNGKHIIKRFQQLVVEGVVDAGFRFLKLTKICLLHCFSACCWGTNYTNPCRAPKDWISL